MYITHIRLLSSIRFLHKYRHIFQKDTDCIARGILLLHQSSIEPTRLHLYFYNNSHLPKLPIFSSSPALTPYCAAASARPSPASPPV
jgi:hypothetical protein